MENHIGDVDQSVLATKSHALAESCVPAPIVSDIGVDGAGIFFAQYIFCFCFCSTCVLLRHYRFLFFYVLVAHVSLVTLFLIHSCVVWFVHVDNL